jgi:hypothetical protein
MLTTLIRLLLLMSLSLSMLLILRETGGGVITITPDSTLALVQPTLLMPLVQSPLLMLEIQK